MFVDNFVLHIGESNIDMIGIIGDSAAEKVVVLHSGGDDDGVIVRYDVACIILFKEEAFVIMTAEHKFDAHFFKRSRPIGINIGIDIEHARFIKGGHIGADVSNSNIKRFALVGKRL